MRNVTAAAIHVLGMGALYVIAWPCVTAVRWRVPLTASRCSGAALLLLDSGSLQVESCTVPRVVWVFAIWVPVTDAWCTALWA